MDIKTSETTTFFSPTTDKILPALFNVKKDMKKLKTERFNPFHNSKYASISDVIANIKEPLSKNGIIVLQPTTIIDTMTVIVTMLIHESGEFVRSFYPVVAKDNSAQNYGSGLTYARRYALVSLLGLEQEDDDGNKADQLVSPNGKTSDSKASTQQLKLMKDLMLKKKLTVSILQEVFPSVNFKDIRMKEATMIINHLFNAKHEESKEE